MSEDKKIINQAECYRHGGDDMCDTFIEIVKQQMLLRVEAIELGDLLMLLQTYKISNAEIQDEIINEIVGKNKNTVQH